MKRNFAALLTITCTMLVVWVLPAAAQSSEVKEKPPLYTYVANWVIPRSQWGEMAKANAADDAILQKALANGAIVGYGSDETLVHTADGSTHDSWWSAMSMAGLLNVLDQFYTTGTATSPVLAGATKHWDSIWVSHYYNWRSGSFKNGYTRVGAYKLAKDAPDDALDTLSKSIIVPLLEKLLADGTLYEYEIDTQAVHTESPGVFLIIYVAKSADGLDKVDAAVRAMGKTNPLVGSSFGSMTQPNAHRDELDLTSGTYK